MMPNERETVNLLDQLRESDRKLTASSPQAHRKLTEALLEIARPAKLDGWPCPWDEYRDEETEGKAEE